MGLKGLVLVFSNSILMITHEYLCEIWVRFDTMHLVVILDDDSEEEGRGGRVGHGGAGGEQEEDAARDGAAHPAGGEAAGRVRQGLQVTQEAPVRARGPQRRDGDPEVRLHGTREEAKEIRSEPRRGEGHLRKVCPHSTLTPDGIIEWHNTGGG